MKYIHVRNLDKYQDGYRDRRHHWAKIYIDMVLYDPELAMLSEVDFSRLVKLIVLETCTKKPQPISDNYLSRLGFDFGLKSLESTLKSLTHFIEIIDVTETHIDDEALCIKPSLREEKSREEKSREDSAHARKGFQKPAIEDLKSLFREKGFPAEAEKFFDYYESNGWRVGKNPMKNWAAAVANWLRHAQAYGTQSGVQKREQKTNPDCSGCGGSGKLPDGKKCWCWS